MDYPTKLARRHDIDWLRTLVVLLLIPFHTARIFDTSKLFYVQNEVLSEKLTFWWIFIGHALGMQLLFLLAGSTTWFALRYRRTGQYVKERFLRLIVPLIFGVLIVVPPQSYYGMLANTDFSGSIIEFYPRFFEAAEVAEGYTGGFTVGHLWFVLFLFLISMVALPLLLFLKRGNGARFIDGLGTFFAKPGTIFLLAIPLIVWDRLIDFNWNDFSLFLFFLVYYLTFFVYGYLLMTEARYWQTVDRYKKIALILGPVLFVIVRGVQATGIMSPTLENFILHLYYRGTFPWLTLIALLGYGKKYLNAPSKFLNYFGEAAYPLYVLHQTVIVAVGYYVVQWDGSILVKYLTITLAAFGVTTLLYEVFVRRNNFVRSLFGMGPRRDPQKGTLIGESLPE